jgi:hypothetical protein
VRIVYVCADDISTVVDSYDADCIDGGHQSVTIESSNRRDCTSRCAHVLESCDLQASCTAAGCNHTAILQYTVLLQLIHNTNIVSPLLSLLANCVSLLNTVALILSQQSYSCS